jgi:hypothetical protein
MLLAAYRREGPTGGCLRKKQLGLFLSLAIISSKRDLKSNSNTTLL